MGLIVLRSQSGVGHLNVDQFTGCKAEHISLYSNKLVFLKSPEYESMVGEVARDENMWTSTPSFDNANGIL